MSLVLAMSKVNRRALIATLAASMILLLAACGSDGVEQAQVVSVTATPVPTTAPLSLPTPTPTPVPAPTPDAAPEATATPPPTPTVGPAALPTATAAPTATLDPAPSPTAASDASPTSTAAPTPTAVAEVIETPTPGAVSTPAAEEPEAAESTPVAETPTAVVAASGEPPLECYDVNVQVYRAFVEGVDELSFEGGRVYCSGAGTNAVSAAASYRHSSGLIIQRNADYIFEAGGTAYIPYSGSVHFCMNGQPASAPVRADTVPALLVVIDNEAQRQLAQGAIGPAAFTSSGAQC